MNSVILIITFFMLLGKYGVYLAAKIESLKGKNRSDIKGLPWRNFSRDDFKCQMNCEIQQFWNFMFIANWITTVSLTVDATVFSSSPTSETDSSGKPRYQGRILIAVVFLLGGMHGHWPVLYQNYLVWLFEGQSFIWFCLFQSDERWQQKGEGSADSRSNNTPPAKKAA